MLGADRIDALILDQYEAQYTLKKLGMDPQKFAVAYTFATKSVLRVRLNANKSSLLPKINAGIKALVNDGTVKRILDSYLK